MPIILPDHLHAPLRNHHRRRIRIGVDNQRYDAGIDHPQPAHCHAPSSRPHPQAFIEDGVRGGGVAHPHTAHRMPAGVGELLGDAGEVGQAPTERLAVIAEGAARNRKRRVAHVLGNRLGEGHRLRHARHDGGQVGTVAEVGGVDEGRGKGVGGGEAKCSGRAGPEEAQRDDKVAVIVLPLSKIGGKSVREGRGDQRREGGHGGR